MTTEPRHYKEEIQELLDGRLSPELRQTVTEHMDACADCRREMEALRWTRSVSAAHLSGAELPPGLEVGILEALDREDRSRPGAGGPRRFWLLRPRALAYGLALLAAGLLLYYFGRPPDLPAAAARDYRELRTRSLNLDLETENVRVMERYFAEHGISFPTRVFDLGMMNYRLEGGRVHRLAGRESALWVYRSAAGRVLVCQMYRGRTQDLPGAQEQRESGGIRFHVYRKNGLTLVFWQEGSITCVLASDIPSEEVIQLAFAKATKV